MGILPLQFKAGQDVKSLGLTGREIYSLDGLSDDFQPQGEVSVRVERQDGHSFTFQAIARLNTSVEVEYYRNGGILHTVLRRMVKGE